MRLVFVTTRLSVQMLQPFPTTYPPLRCVDAGWLVTRLSCGYRVAYDRLVADFEALECVRHRLQRRRAGVGEPPDYASGALAAEEAAERYLTKMPAGQQTREAVSEELMRPRYQGLFVLLPTCRLALSAPLSLWYNMILDSPSWWSCCVRVHSVLETSTGEGKLSYQVPGTR